jgi:hypothetical protein
MKKLILKLIIILFSICLSGCSFIFLSQKSIVKNNNYPTNKKEQISKFKAELNNAAALKIIETSLASVPSTIIYGLEEITVDGIRSSTLEQVTDREERLPDGTIKTYNHIEKVELYLPLKEITRVYIESGKWVHFVTVKDVSHNYSFGIKSGADEISLIASILYLCNNIDD